MSYYKSVGPAVWRKDGKFCAACLKSFSGGMIACAEYRGHAPGGGWCGRMNREIPDYGETPEWCDLRASMIEDAEMGFRFDALGLRPHIKKDVLKVIRAMPKEHRPKRARELTIMQLQNAIQRAIADGWEMTTCPA